MKPRASGALVAFTVFSVCLAAPLRAESDGLPAVFPAIAEVREPVFSILIGLVSHDCYGTLTRARLEEEISRTGRKSHLPWREVREVVRTSVEPGRTAEVSVIFERDVDLPVPYSLLGYHPGSFTASDTCLFREWILGPVTLRHPYEERGQTRYRDVVLEDVHAFGVGRGKVAIDFDGWLDRLLGGSLDDTEVRGLLLFRWDGRWVGVATGYNKDHSGRSGGFDFAKDEILFPGPDEVKTIGRTMRSRMESWMPHWPTSRP